MTRLETGSGTGNGEAYKPAARGVQITEERQLAVTGAPNVAQAPGKIGFQAQHGAGGGGGHRER